MLIHLIIGAQDEVHVEPKTEHEVMTGIENW